MVPGHILVFDEAAKALWKKQCCHFSALNVHVRRLAVLTRSTRLDSNLLTTRAHPGGYKSTLPDSPGI